MFTHDQVVKITEELQRLTNGQLGRFYRTNPPKAYVDGTSQVAYYGPDSAGQAAFYYLGMLQRVYEHLNISEDAMPDWVRDFLQTPRTAPKYSKAFREGIATADYWKANS